MSEMAIEMLSAERVNELWPELEPYFTAACKGNEIADDEMDANDIYLLTQTDMAVVFAGYMDQKLACVMALQINMTNGRKGADIIAMAGSGMMKFKTRYWPSILEWLRANGVQFVDAYAPERLAKLYMSKFGFTKSCSYVRMSL
jgi:hypothetical protein